LIIIRLRERVEKLTSTMANPDLTQVLEEDRQALHGLPMAALLGGLFTWKLRESTEL
jgi:hypothetical protein